MTQSKISVPITIPALAEAEARAAYDAVLSRWIAQGPRNASFESAFATMAGSSHALTCSNGTAALHLSLAALGIGPGDDVIVPAFTWIATANVVELLGANAVLCDVDPKTFVAHVEHFEAVLTPNTKAIMPVHLFGYVAPMAPILAFAEKHGLYVVEDAACAVGSWLDGTHAGAFGDMGTFSFHPRKTITSGEGGLILTQSDDHAQRLASLRNHGAEGLLAPPSVDPSLTHDRDALFKQHPGAAAYVMAEFPRPGFNYRLTDIQAAILQVQLDALPQLIAARTQRAARYSQALADLPLDLPTHPSSMIHSWQSYTVSVCSESPHTRDQLADQLALHGIQTRQGTHALHLLDYYATTKHLHPTSLPGALHAHRNSLALPLYPSMTDEEQSHVIDTLHSVLQK